VQNKSPCLDKAFQAGRHITSAPSVRFKESLKIFIYINLIPAQSKSYQHIADKQGFRIISIFLVIALKCSVFILPNAVSR
jgi:hypothetical protein